MGQSFWTFQSRVGVTAIGAGVGLIVLGWYGASGEALVAAQVPYLASATIPGAAAVIAGAVLLAGAFDRQRQVRTETLVTMLASLMVETADHQNDQQVSPTAVRPSGDAAADMVALPDGTRFHVRSCALVDNKPGLTVVGDPEIRERHLEACLMCRPRQRRD